MTTLNAQDPASLIAKLKRQTKALVQTMKSRATQQRVRDEVFRTANTNGIWKKLLVRRFQTQGSSTGKPWAPLTMSTVQQRKRLGFGPGPILYRVGVLKSSVVNGRFSIQGGKLNYEIFDQPAPVYNGQGGRKRAPNRKWAKTGKMVSAYLGVNYGLDRKRYIIRPFTKIELKSVDRALGSITKKVVNKVWRRTANNLMR